MHNYYNISLNKLIQIKPKSIVKSKLLGIYKTLFKGNGQDYLQSRHYEEGDDARYLDSRLTARNIEIYTKEFTEERQNEVVLLLDVSNSVLTNLIFFELMNEYLAIITFLMDLVHQSNDKLGFIAFTDKIIDYEIPNRNYSSIVKIKKILNNNNYGTTNISEALNFLYKNYKRNSLVLIFSDFFDDSYYDKLRLASLKFDIILINLIINFNFCESGYLNIDDSETSYKATIKAKDLNYTDFLHQLQRITKKNNIEYIETESFKDFINKFYKLMLRRLNLRHQV